MGDTAAPDFSGLELGEQQTLVERITHRLVDYLLSSDIKPGTKIPSERRLAELLGVGRSAVREALKALSMLGLLEIRQGDGTYVKHAESDLLPRVVEWGLLLGHKRTLDLVEARSQLELVTARLAAERRTDEDLAELTHRLDAMRREPFDLDSFMEADIGFHLAVAKSSANSVLVDIMRSVQSLLRVWIARSTRSAADPRIFIGQHAAILDAVAAGDPERAEAAMNGHMESAAGHLMATLETSRRDDRR